jgi:two-component sensor histidine kinase
VDGGRGRGGEGGRERDRKTVLPQEMEQHLLRIAQEAVTNVVKHAGANRIAIKLHTEARKLRTCGLRQRARFRGRPTCFPRTEAISG